MNLEPKTAYVLHTRPYRENSALVDFFCQEGRYRGVCRKAKNAMGSLVRPFQPLEIIFKGRGELKTLVALDAKSPPHVLNAEALYSGLYLNELLMRVIPMEVAHPEIFKAYQQTLEGLSKKYWLEKNLRWFEWQLLQDMGYAFSLHKDTMGRVLEPHRQYCLVNESGLKPLDQSDDQSDATSFLGQDMIALREGQWENRQVLIAAKRLMRLALKPYLGDKPMATRELFSNIKNIFQLGHD